MNIAIFHDRRDFYVDLMVKMMGDFSEEYLQNHAEDIMHSAYPHLSDAWWSLVGFMHIDDIPTVEIPIKEDFDRRVILYRTYTADVNV